MKSSYHVLFLWVATASCIIHLCANAAPTDNTTSTSVSDECKALPNCEDCSAHPSCRYVRKESACNADLFANGNDSVCVPEAELDDKCKANNFSCNATEELDGANFARNDSDVGGKVPPEVGSSEVAKTTTVGVGSTTSPDTTANDTGSTEDTSATTANTPVTTESSSSVVTESSSSKAPTLGSSSTSSGGTSSEVSTDSSTISSTELSSSSTVDKETTTSGTPGRRFDPPSFIGGIVLALGLLAIAYVGFKFYRARTEHNYHTL